MISGRIERADAVAEDRDSASAARWGLAGLSLSMLLSSLGTSIANVGLPTFAKAFGASFQQVQWVVLAYLLAVTALIVSAGRLGDLLGRRRLLLAALALFTVASLLCGLAPSLPLLISARAIQGLGAALLMALTLAFVGETVPKERTGAAMGLLGTTSALGTALGPSLGGVLIAGAGWPALFFLNVPLGAVAFVLARRFLPADPRRPTTAPVGFDSLGTTLLAATLGAFALAMTLGRGRFGATNAALLVAALLGAALFLLAERRAPSPLVPLETFKDVALSAGFATSTLVTTVVMATLVVGPFYLSGALGLDTARIGLVLSAGPIVAALVGVPAGRLVDRFGTHRATLAGLLAMAAGSASLALLPASLGIPGYVAPLVVVTAGYALFQAANNTAVMAAAGTARRGVVSGLLNLSRNLGLIAGASLMGALFAFGSGASHEPTASPAAVASGMRLTFAVAAGLVGLALGIARAAGRRTADLRLGYGGRERLVGTPGFEPGTP